MTAKKKPISKEKRPVKKVESVNVPPTSENLPPPQDVKDEQITENHDKTVVVDVSESHTEDEKTVNDATVTTVASLESQTKGGGEGEYSGAVSSTRKKGKGSFLMFLLICFFFGFLLGVVVMFLLSVREKAVTESQQTTSEITPTITPTATPTPSVDLSAYTITIQNGSGISGEAARAKEKLEAAGFTVASTGNADTSDYQTTVISAKDAVSKYFLDKLKETLGSSYTLGEIKQMVDTQDSDVIVIIGNSSQ